MIGKLTTVLSFQEGRLAPTCIAHEALAPSCIAHEALFAPIAPQKPNSSHSSLIPNPGPGTHTPLSSRLHFNVPLWLSVPILFLCLVLSLFSPYTILWFWNRGDTSQYEQTMPLIPWFLNWLLWLKYCVAPVTFDYSLCQGITRLKTFLLISVSPPGSSTFHLQSSFLGVFSPCEIPSILCF